MMAPPLPETNGFFNRQWQTYHRVVDCNYMKHRELAVLLQDYLLAAFRRPYTLLDLGCGDAVFTAQALRGTQLCSYVGVDLSEPALDLARQTLAPFRCQQLLIPGDLSQTAAN